MKYLLALIFAFIVCGCAIAQSAAQTASNGNQAALASASSTSTSPNSANGTPRIAPGSVIPVHLTKSIDVKKAKTGDEVDAKVTQDLKTQNGMLLVPKDTRMVGHVTDVQPHGKERESKLGITFDHEVAQNGTSVPLPMSIQAVVVPGYFNRSNSGEGAPEAGMPSQPAGMSPGGSAGRNGSMGNGMPQEAPNPSPLTSDEQNAAAQNRPSTPPITASTQGVFGKPDLKLSAPPDPAQGSLLSSEKENIKLDDGTLLLLRVNP